MEIVGISYVGIAIFIFALLKSDGFFKAAIIGLFWFIPFMFFIIMTIASRVMAVKENKSPR
ncbi:hypothetical protein D3C80_1916340 [compost metagenome]